MPIDNTLVRRKDILVHCDTDPRSIERMQRTRSNGTITALMAPDTPHDRLPPNIGMIVMSQIHAKIA